MKLSQLTKPLAAAIVLGFASTASALTAEDASAILFMKQEEKLARDVYTALHAKWGGRIFANIVAAEQTHMDAVTNLIVRYRLADPTPAEPGKFTYPELQDLYDQLVRDGQTSLTDALEVGVTIEEADITDLQAAIAATSERPIKMVFGNLLNGSLNHLAAFTKSLQ